MAKEPVRGVILRQATAATLGDRNRSYGDPLPNLTVAGELKAVYRKAAGAKYHPAHDEAIDMVLSKIARIACGAPGHTDNYIDGSAYFAIAAECQMESEIQAEIAAEAEAAARSRFLDSQDAR